MRCAYKHAALVPDGNCDGFPAKTSRRNEMISRRPAERSCESVRLGGYPRGQSTLGRNPVFRTFLLASLTLALGSAAVAQVPVADLNKPPATATHYIIQSTGGKHGDSWIWTGADGTRMGRESMNLRGQVFELDSSGKAGRGRHADVGHRSAVSRRRATRPKHSRLPVARRAGRARWMPAARLMRNRRSICRRAVPSTCRRGRSSGCSPVPITRSRCCLAAGRRPRN